MNQTSSQKAILVTGATGKQGGATARRLLEKGFRVKALTRDPDKPAALSLKALGAELSKGDLDDRASLNEALLDCNAVFSVQAFWEVGVEGEIRQGKALADAAKEAGIGHLVYSSVGSAGRNTGIPHFASKWQVEEHIRALGLPYTILRPAAFMENWETSRSDIEKGTLALPLDPERKLQQVAVDDIALLASEAFEDGSAWQGREIELSGDELNMTDMALTFSRALNRSVEYRQVPWAEFEKAAGEETTVMFRWFNDVGYNADIAALRAEHPQLITLEDYLRRAGWTGQSGMNVYE